MPRVGLPIQLTSSISERAATLARTNLQGRGWSPQSSGSIMAFPREGVVGFRTTLKYVMIQNKGFQPFLMFWVEGRTVPMTCAFGDGPHFVRGKDVGKPGWVNIPHRGRVWRDQKWRHPGLKPKRYLEDSLSRSIMEHRPKIKQEMLKVLGGESKL